MPGRGGSGDCSRRPSGSSPGCPGKTGSASVGKRKVKLGSSDSLNDGQDIHYMSSKIYGLGRILIFTIKFSHHAYCRFLILGKYLISRFSCFSSNIKLPMPNFF